MRAKTMTPAMPLRCSNQTITATCLRRGQGKLSSMRGCHSCAPHLPAGEGPAPGIMQPFLMGTAMFSTMGYHHQL